MDPVIHRWAALPHFPNYPPPLRGPNVPLENCFDKIALRGAWDRDADYLLLKGFGAGQHGHPDANQIAQYQARGRLFIAETGYPVRADFLKWDRPSARKTLGLHEDKPVLLVTGGSRGARSINQAVLECLPSLLELAQVIHISGQLDWPTVEAAANSQSGTNRRDYHAFPYLHEEMGAALAASDLVVSRAGASSLGEYPLLGLPAVLVPYPHAWRYQKVNADYLAIRGAAVLLEDSRLKEELFNVVQSILTDSAKREAMRVSMSALTRPQAARQIAQQLIELAGEVRP